MKRIFKNVEQEVTRSFLLFGIFRFITSVHFCPSLHPHLPRPRARPQVHNGPSLMDWISTLLKSSPGLSCMGPVGSQPKRGTDKLYRQIIITFLTVFMAFPLTTPLGDCYHVTLKNWAMHRHPFFADYTKIPFFAGLKSTTLAWKKGSSMRCPASRLIKTNNNAILQKKATETN